MSRKPEADSLFISRIEQNACILRLTFQKMIWHQRLARLLLRDFQTNKQLRS
jgi:hypothetical protein